MPAKKKIKQKPHSETLSTARRVGMAALISLSMITAGTALIQRKEARQASATKSGQPESSEMATAVLGAESPSKEYVYAGGKLVATEETRVCSYSLSPSYQNFAASGGTGSISVTAATACSWSVVGVPLWVSITSGSSGNGNGTVSYSVAANTGSSRRSATLTIAGQPFTIYQGVEFADVPANHPFYTFIGKLSARGVTTGCGVNAQGQAIFCPDWIVTREQMAVFTIRALGVDPPTPPSQRFA